MEKRKPEFITKLDVRDMGKGKWQLLSRLVYYSAILRGLITVPKGYQTDFASTPRVPFIYSMFGNKAHREAVIHDFLYSTHQVKKSKADKIFLEAMKLMGKSWWVREPMYLAVKWFGRSSFKSGPSRYKNLNK